LSEFDWSEHKDKLVTVKVDGELIKVPLNEAMNGYMRQKHFTQQTQALAEERRLAVWAQEMQQAIQNDPEGTVRALQNALGLNSGVVADPYADLDPDIQPLARTIQEQQRQLAELQRALSQVNEQTEDQRLFNEVKAELEEAKMLFADFDPKVVVPIAAERGLTVTDAYKLWKADQVLNAEKAQTEAQRKAAEKAKTENAKRKASQSVSRGGSSSGSASAAPADIRNLSFEELLVRNLSQKR
jgi:hypothetical protein